ncbi:MAG: hypothetical protein R3C05_01455 [Pirellulaceae bacterium]
MNATPEATPKLTLGTATQFVKGVGSARAELLLKLGLRTAGDLLFHLLAIMNNPQPACGSPTYPMASPRPLSERSPKSII